VEEDRINGRIWRMLPMGYNLKRHYKGIQTFEIMV
jgi:hypothetical protein